MNLTDRPSAHSPLLQSFFPTSSGSSCCCAPEASALTIHSASNPSPEASWNPGRGRNCPPKLGCGQSEESLMVSLAAIGTIESDSVPSRPMSSAYSRRCALVGSIAGSAAFNPLGAFVTPLPRSRGICSPCHSSEGEPIRPRGSLSSRLTFGRPQMMREPVCSRSGEYLPSKRNAPFALACQLNTRALNRPRCLVPTEALLAVSALSG